VAISPRPKPMNSATGPSILFSSRALVGCFKTLLTV
jgi:hypothetical protein